MTREFEDYKKKVASEYEKKYLSPQFGEGKIKQNLLEALVSTLDNFSIPEKAPKDTEKIDEFDYSHLRNKMDYNKLYNLEDSKGMSGSAKRIQNIFKNMEFETPLDIIDFVYFHGYPEKEHGDWQTYDGKELYKKVLGDKLRQFGNKTSNLLMDYLESEGFDFSKEYAEKIMNDIDEKKK